MRAVARPATRIDNQGATTTATVRDSAITTPAAGSRAIIIPMAPAPTTSVTAAGSRTRTQRSASPSTSPTKRASRSPWPTVALPGSSRLTRRTTATRRSVSTRNEASWESKAFGVAEHATADAAARTATIATIRCSTGGCFCSTRDQPRRGAGQHDCGAGRQHAETNGTPQAQSPSCVRSGARARVRS